MMKRRKKAVIKEDEGVIVKVEIRLWKNSKRKKREHKGEEK